ncbi:MAG: polymer-forming cytoskeletal protein [Chitinimonas sp.]|nr:polymer-forming cytoskeletal protein [Chitinimonas sp.]
MFNKTSPLARHNANGQESDNRTTSPSTPSQRSVGSAYSGLELGTAPPKPAPEPITTTPAAKTDSDSPSQLSVGPNVKLKGAEILDCDTLVVEGRVEATMDSRVLRIAEKGAFSGKVSIDIAEIHGHFDGELTVRQQLVVHATGRVNGTIRYGKMLVEEGGELSGDVRSLNAQATRPEGLQRTEARPVQVEAANSKPLNGTLG